MKKIQLYIVTILMTVTLVACAQNKNETIKNNTEKVTPKKEATLEMNKDSLNSKVIAEIEEELVKRKVELTTEALTTIGKTQSLLRDIDSKKKDVVLKNGKELLADLEILLTKDPTLAVIPVNISSQKEEFVADINTVHSAIKSAQKAMNKGYYRVASDILKDLRSEMVINTYLIPTATYPKAIKVAMALIEDGEKGEAKLVLQKVLSTIIIEKTVLPLPVLNAEQMIIEAAKIDKKDHENVDKVMNLLKNADYQLQLAEELGYGKKDKEFALLSSSINELKKSVNKKEDSKMKFDSLKIKIRKFKERLFPKKSNK